MHKDLKLQSFPCSAACKVSSTPRPGMGGKNEIRVQEAATFAAGDLRKTHFQGEQHVNLPNKIQDVQLHVNFR